MDDGSILALAVMVALIALSGFFSAVETAFSSLNEIRLKSRAEDGDAAAARVLAMAQQHDKLFSTILVGDTIANLAAASLGVLLLIRPLGALRGTIVSAVVLAVVILLFGEIGPRSMAREIPEKVATASVPAMRFFIPLLTPLTGLFGLWNKLVTHCFHSKAEPDSITEGELITMVSEAESEGELTDREGELIRSAIEFDDVEVGEILTPRVDVVAVKDTVSFDELAEVFAETGYSRLPVYHGTIDDIVGVVHEKDFSKARMRGLTSLHALVTPALFTTGATKISSMLRTFREEHHHMAVVVDEYGGTEGIITLEDILEELVGEIWDEHDEAVEDFRPQKDGSWLVAGTVRKAGHPAAGDRLQHRQRPAAGPDRPSAQGRGRLPAGPLHRRSHPCGPPPRDRSAAHPAPRPARAGAGAFRPPLLPHSRITAQAPPGRKRPAGPLFMSVLHKKLFW